jgi:hypothetical protein
VKLSRVGETSASFFSHCIHYSHHLSLLTFSIEMMLSSNKRASAATRNAARNACFPPTFGPSKAIEWQELADCVDETKTAFVQQHMQAWNAATNNRQTTVKEYNYKQLEYFEFCEV